VSIEQFRLPRPVSLAAARQISRLVGDFGARLVHSHEFSMAVYGAVAARRAGIPQLVTMHCSRYYAQRLRRRLAMRWVLRRSSLVAVSGNLAGHLCQDLGISPTGIEIVANGVELAAGRPDAVRSELGLGSSDTLLLAVGNLYPVKGHRYLIEAVSQLATRRSALHLAIAGRGNELASLQAQADATGLSGRVHFLGLRNDVADLLAAADVFIHPSLSEGLPIAVLEAMTAGRPVVATAVGDVLAALGGGEAGVIVAPGDAAALAVAIESLLNDPERARSLASRARSRALVHYGVLQMVSSYERIYHRLVAA
jgi:glycosyltransferase involved in cell wall biosynthesis